MKKIISFILILSLSLALCACGRKEVLDKEESVPVTDPYAKYQALIDALEAGKYEQAHAFINAMDPSPATPAPTPAPYVEYVKVYFYTNELTDADFTMRLSQGEEGDITLKAVAYPENIEHPVFKWSVDQEGILELTPSEFGSECLIHQIGVLEKGVVITVECGNASCTVKCLAFD